MASVNIRYWAAAKDAAGVAEEPVDARTLADAISVACSRRVGDSRFAAVLARSSFLVDGVQAGHQAAEEFALPDKAVIEVLPAFAGG